MAIKSPTNVMMTVRPTGEIRLHTTAVPTIRLDAETIVVPIRTLLVTVIHASEVQKTAIATLVAFDATTALLTTSFGTFQGRATLLTRARAMANQTDIVVRSICTKDEEALETFLGETIPIGATSGITNTFPNATYVWLLPVLPMEVQTATPPMAIHETGTLTTKIPSPSPAIPPGATPKIPRASLEAMAVVEEGATRPGP